MAQGFEATQAAINQLLANQGGQLAVMPSVPIPEPPVAVNVPVQNNNGNHYTLEKFIKNGAKVFTGTTDPEKAEAWTLNMLKSFRVMEVLEAHWVRLATCRLEDKVVGSCTEVELCGGGRLKLSLGRNSLMFSTSCIIQSSLGSRNRGNSLI